MEVDLGPSHIVLDGDPAPLPKKGTEHPQFSAHFWATVCKTVRPMLSVRCPVCLSVTFVHFGQTVRRIKMKLGMQVGLGPGHIALDGDPAPPASNYGTRKKKQKSKEDNNIF